MAAVGWVGWVIAGMLAVGLVAAVAAWNTARRQVDDERHRADSLEHTTLLLDGQLTMSREMLQGQAGTISQLTDRLVEYALPQQSAREGADANVVEPRHDPEYEPPLEPVMDWTDPFMGLEREMVGGLRPGQGIPGIGADAGDVGGEPVVADPTDETLSDDAFRQWLATQETE